MSGCNALGLANYFLDKAEAEGRELTHMHLQKILYNAHGYYLAMTGDPLFYQNVQAWKNGPVIPEVYKAFKKCGRDPIAIRATRPASLFDIEGSPYEEDLDEETRSFLDAIWEGHKSISAVKLSAISHVRGGPWDQVARGKNLELHHGIEIPNPIIQKYFEMMTKEW